MHNDLKECEYFDTESLNGFEKRLKYWLKLYLQVYAANTVTPYMHIFVIHTKELFIRHGAINKFNCQKLEKLNCTQKTVFHHATNGHHDQWNITSMYHRLRRELDFIGIKDVDELKELKLDESKRQIEIYRLESTMNFPKMNIEENTSDWMLFNSWTIEDPKNFDIAIVRTGIFNIEKQIKEFIKKCQQVKAQQIYSEKNSKVIEVKERMDLCLNNKYNNMYEAVKITRDKHNLFKSVSMCLFNTEKHHLKLRFACLYIVFKCQNYFIEIIKSKEESIERTDDDYLGILIYSICYRLATDQEICFLAALTIVMIKNIT